jgi:hypothetical protein
MLASSFISTPSALAAGTFTSNPAAPGPIVFPSTSVSTSGGISSTASLLITNTNATASNLTISDASITGTNAARFSIVVTPTGAAAEVLAIGTSLPITVACAPTATGTITASLIVTHNATTGASPVTYTLSCTGVKTFDSNPAPASNVPVTATVNTTVTRTLTISNTGSVPVTITSLSLVGSPVLTITPSTTFTVDVGITKTIGITCTPTVVGVFTSALTLTTTDSLQPTANYNLICNSAQTFGSNPAAGSSIAVTSTVGTPVTRTLTISNTGSLPLTITNLSLVGSPVFTATPVISSTSPLTVAVGLTKSIGITCTPTALGVFTASLTLTATDSITTTAPLYNLTCTGTAVGASNLVYYPLPNPIRVVDTRAGQPAKYSGAGAYTAGQTVTYTLAGISYTPNVTTTAPITIPAAAQAVAANLVTVSPVGQGFLTIYPGSDIAGANRPLISSLSYRNGTVNSNTSYLSLDTNGVASVYSLRATDLVIDISGYYAPAGTADPNNISTGLLYYPLPNPIRVVDTRAGQPAKYSGAGQIAAGTTVNYTLNNFSYSPNVTTTTPITIPAAAKALVANTTAVLPVGQGYLTIYPGGATQPLISSLNYRDGDVTGSGSYPTLSATGIANIFSLRTTDLVIDVSGYFAPIGTVDPNGATGLYYTALRTPIRVLDTRTAVNGGGRAYYSPINTNGNIATSFTVSSTSSYTLTGISYTPSITDTGLITIPTTAKALVANTTGLNSSINGYFTIYPNGATQPVVSSLNYRVGYVTNNPSHATVGTSGIVKIYSLQIADAIMDVSGYYAP